MSEYGVRSLELIESFGAPHASAIVIGEDGRVLGHHGDLHRTYRLASVTKLLTTYCTLIATEEETLSLDDPAGPSGATVRHLLSHASGVSLSDARVVLAVPGAKRIYSNAGIELVADELARRSGMSFEEYLQTGITEPLAMTSTQCLGSPAADGWSTISDLGRLLAEFLSPTLISRELFGVATSVAFPGIDGVVPGFGRQHPCDWGLGFEMKSTKSPHWTGRRNALTSFGHFGQSGTLLLVDPVARYGVSLLTDRDFELWAKELWPPFLDAIAEELGVTDPGVAAPKVGSN